MRILFSALGFGRNDRFGGSVRIAADNAIELASRGHDITFYCTNLVDKSEKLYSSTVEKIIEGVKVVYHSTYTIPFWPGSFGISYSPRLRRWLNKESSFDVIHLNEYRSYLSVVLAKHAFNRGIPLILQPQGTLIVDNTSKIIKIVFELLFGKNALKRVDRIIAATLVEKQIAIEKGVLARKIVEIPVGIHLSKYRNLPKNGYFRHRFNIPKGKKIVLFVGRIDRNKGVDLLIEGFTNIGHPDAFLVIVGPDHGYKNFIEKLIQKNDIRNRVLITGNLPDYSDVLSAIVDADVLVVPSRSEAFGMVVLEGSILKKAMVLSNGCHISAQYGDSALVVPPLPDEICSAVAKLLIQPALAQKLGENAYRLVNNRFEFSKVVDGLEKAYLEVCGES
jgi:glycosyltransferase involved in cell wall biosynthesis